MARTRRFVAILAALAAAGALAGGVAYGAGRGNAGSPPSIEQGNGADNPNEAGSQANEDEKEAGENEAGQNEDD